MDGIIGIFQSILNSDGLDVYLEALEEHQSFRSKIPSDVDTVVQTISSLLMKPSSRPLGLTILNRFLEQCSVEVVEQKGNLWATLTLKACNLRELESNTDAVFEALAKLAVISQQSPDLIKTFAGNHLAKIYEALSHVPVSGHLAALRCTESCLRLYPGSSGPSKGLIERFLEQFIDCSVEELSRCCGKCLHLLQQVRGGGVQGMNHKTQWQKYQEKLLGSLHAVLDDAFAKCSEIYDDPVERDQLSLPVLELSDEPVQRAVELYVRFRNLVGYLETALREPFPVGKPIMPRKILNLISRGLEVTCSSLQCNAISDNLALGAFLPKMQLHLLQLLQELMLTLRTHLRENHQLILSLLASTLKSTSSHNSVGVKKPLSNLRTKAYELISLWCLTMRGGSRSEIIAELLVQEVFYDVSPFQTGFTLQVLSGARKHMSKKARRQLHKAQNEQSNLAQTHSKDNTIRKENLSDEGNQALCIAALRCLQQVLLSSANFMKPTAIKIIQTKVMQICGLFYEMPLKRQQLYNNSVCRYEMYNTLYIVLITPHHLCPPPTQMAVSILRTAHQRDAIPRVRHHCGAILLNLEKLIHPQKESLLFPSDFRDIRNAFIKFGKEHLLSGPSIVLLSGDDGSLQESEDEEEIYKDTLAEVPVEDITIELSNEEDSGANNIDEVLSFDVRSSESVVMFESVDETESFEDATKSLESERRSECYGNPNGEVVEYATNDMHANGHSDEGVFEETDLSAPAPKKPKLQSVKVTQSASEEPEPGTTVGSLGDDDLLIADIEAAFVDELN